MKQKINIIIISIIAVLMIIVSFIFAINYKKNSVTYFNDSGYIISNLYTEDNDSVNKLYFDNGVYYKNTSDDKYSFINSDGERVNVDKESFVHYSNGAIMALKKGVAIDLNIIDSKLISYYNIFEGSVLQKNGELYEIDNLNKKITFSKVMFKISNNKYLIAAPNIIVSFSDDQTIKMNKYVEIEYASENVVRVYNDEVNYQTIASNLYIIVDDVKIDLEYKTISKKDVKYLTMADMVINSDDNIEVLPLPGGTEVIEPDKNDVNDSNNIQNDEKLDSGLQEGFDNIIGNVPELNKENEGENIIQPKFKVDNINVTTLGFENLKMSFQDESAILYGERTVEILENSTGKVVQKFEDWEEGAPDYVVNSYFSLNPNTEYTINVVGQYKIGDTVYDRTFISKVFRTLDLGLEIRQDYVTSESLSFAVYRNSYSEVNGFTYNIKDKDGNIIVDDTAIKYNDDSTEVLVFSENDKFKPNTSYVLTLKNIQYGNDVFLTVSYESLQLVYEVKTLKENPFITNGNNEFKLNSNIDSRNNSVIFSLDGINDINGGIREYKYNIYDSNNILKYSVTKNDSSNVVLDLNKINASNVYFNVDINFEDNEKTVVYSSNNSNPINISGISYPKVVHYSEAENNSDYETLKGEILLDDESNYIPVNKVSHYRVVLKEKVNDVLDTNQQYVETDKKVMEYRKTESEYALPIYFEGLKPSTDYVLYVYLIQNEKDIYLGYADAKTKDPEPVYLDFYDETIEGAVLFDFKIKKQSENISNTKLKKIDLDLYKCSNEECENLEEHSISIPAHRDNMDLYNMLLGNEIINVSSNDFNFFIDDYESEYSYKIIVTGHSYDYEFPEIPIIINDTGTNEYNLVFNEIVPPLNLNIVDILKSNSSELVGNNSIKEIKNDTIIGFNFEVSTNETPMKEIFDKMYYTIYEGVCENAHTEKITGIVEFDFREKVFFLPVDTDMNTDALKRGKNYCIKYKGEYINNNNEIITSEEQSKDFIARKQQAEIDGYIKEYNGSNLVFKLNIIDPDRAMVLDSMSLIDTTNEEKAELISAPSDSMSGEYNYKVENGKSYILKFVENIGYTGPINGLTDINEYMKQGEKEFKIYDVKLDKVINSNEININVDSSTIGYIKLSIPYCDKNLSDCAFNVLNKDYLNRIAGLRINDQIIGLTLSDLENELFTKINLSDIEKNGYGSIKNGKLNFEPIELVYDSGKIADYKLDEELFVKSKVEELYYDSKSQKFISNPSSIFSKKSINDLKIDSAKFVSSDELSSIGHLLEEFDGNKRFIHFNVGENVIANIADDIPVTEIVSTSKIETKYTSIGAEVSFDVTTGEKEGMNLIVELNSENGDVLASESIKYSKGEWSSRLIENEYIESIEVDREIITIKFKGITDRNYYYSLKFKSDGSDLDEYTYNDDTQSNNKDIAINSLKNLKVTYKSVIVEQSGWKFAENFKDLSFDRKMLIDFNIDMSQYKLVDKESIVYKIIAKSATGSETILTEENVVNDINHKEYSLSSKESLKIGTYQIILESIIKNTKLGDIKLEDIVLKDELLITSKDPSLVVTSTGEPIFDITIRDSDGKLTACSNLTNINTTKLMKHVDDNSKIYFEYVKSNQKVVYSELYSLNDGVEVYRGYTPIPFANVTSRLDLKQYFYENKLSSGNYRVKLKYCTDVEGIEKFNEIISDFYIFNLANLNIEILSLPDSYILMLDNPGEEEKESIKKIEYQYILVDGTVVTRVLDNTNDIFNNTDNFEFIVSKGTSGTVYFLGLSTGSTLTANIKSLIINFYNDKGNVIAQWSK